MAQVHYPITEGAHSIYPAVDWYDDFVRLVNPHGEIAYPKCDGCTRGPLYVAWQCGYCPCPRRHQSRGMCLCLACAKIHRAGPVHRWHRAVGFQGGFLVIPHCHAPTLVNGEWLTRIWCGVDHSEGITIGGA